MDENSLLFLNSIGVPFIKIGSGDAQNKPLLKRAAQLKVPLVISTGMCNMKAVEEIEKIVSKVHNDFALLHCVSSYPTAVHDINLNVLKTYQKRFPGIMIGYSGHEEGIEHSIAAVQCGAKILERHFTLDKTLKGSDHGCSLTPDELKKLVHRVRNLKKEDCADLTHSPALGSYEKKILASEEACMRKLGKSIVAARDLCIGTVITEADISVKVAEPSGIFCGEYDSVLGQTLNGQKRKDESLFWSDLRPI